MLTFAYKGLSWYEWLRLLLEKWLFITFPILFFLFPKDHLFLVIWLMILLPFPSLFSKSLAGFCFFLRLSSEVFLEWIPILTFFTGDELSFEPLDQSIFLIIPFLYCPYIILSILECRLYFISRLNPFHKRECEFIFLIFYFIFLTSFLKYIFCFLLFWILRRTNYF